MTYKFWLLDGKCVDIVCPYCGNADKFYSQGKRKGLYHMFRCAKCDKCHSRFLDTGNIVVDPENLFEYDRSKTEICSKCGREVSSSYINRHKRIFHYGLSSR